MKRPVLLNALLPVLLAGASALPLTQAYASTVLFSGSQSNTNAPGAPGGRCAGATVNIGNAAPFFSTGSSNVGSFSTAQSHCLNSGPPVAVGAADVPYYDGLFTYTFADGDTLFGDYVGTLSNGGSMGLVDNLQTFTITGGSGAFAGATGGFTGEGTIAFIPGQAPLSQITFSGAFDAPGIPEPAAWALLILGFGGVGAALRRRRGLLPLPA
jgi:hypothetical protein